MVVYSIVGYKFEPSIVAFAEHPEHLGKSQDTQEHVRRFSAYVFENRLVNDWFTCCSQLGRFPTVMGL
jgi:hypothetical protein